MLDAVRTMVKMVASVGRMNRFPTSNDCAVLEQDMIGTDGSKQCQRRRHRLASMGNSRKAADWAGLALAEAPPEVHEAADAVSPPFAEGGLVPELLRWFGWR